jgi:hypothetical protein
MGELTNLNVGGRVRMNGVMALLTIVACSGGEPTDFASTSMALKPTIDASVPAMRHRRRRWAARPRTVSSK